MRATHSHHRRSTAPARRPTIRDVAADAGVSKTSVSRYFGAEHDRLSPHLKSRIAESVARLGFAPDRIAASLRGGRTRLIAALVADIRNPYSVALIHAVELACAEAGYALLICNTDNDPAVEYRQLDALAGYSVEGLIVHTATGDAGPLKGIGADGPPIVLVDRRIPQLACDVVRLDDAAAIAAAIAHLQDAGYRDITLVSEPAEGISSRESRVAAFLEQCPHHGLTHRAHELIVDDLDSFDRLIADRLTSARPAAILAASGIVNLALCRAFDRAGKATFSRLGLMGIDELDWCALVGPGISTLAQPVDAIGRHAVQALIGRIAGHTTHAFTETRLAGHVIARGSTRLGV